MHVIIMKKWNNAKNVFNWITCFILFYVLFLTCPRFFSYNSPKRKK